MNTVVAIVILAVFIEELAESVKGRIEPRKLPQWAWLGITGVIGAVLCVLFKVDLFEAIGFAGDAAAQIIGRVLTGFMIGAGSGVVHRLLDRLAAAKAADKKAAGHDDNAGD
ncbi:MAG: hypothetical protein WDA65_08995 [Christensenellales bacterium]